MDTEVLYIDATDLLGLKLITSLEPVVATLEYLLDCQVGLSYITGVTGASVLEVSVTQGERALRKEFLFPSLAVAYQRAALEVGNFLVEHIDPSPETCEYCSFMKQTMINN